MSAPTFLPPPAPAIPVKQDKGILIDPALAKAGWNVSDEKQVGIEIPVDGVDALEKLSNEPVDMLVTDLNMPNLDGINLIQEVRQKPGNRFMPIIMLTSESQPEKKSAGKAAGASGWITKPFNPDQLLAVVRMVCPT